MKNKVKLFQSIDIKSLESEVNEWLEKMEEISTFKIVDRNLSSRSDQFAVIAIYYTI